MKLQQVIHTELKVTPYGDRLWQLTDDLEIKLVTNEGTLIFKLQKGFVTNFRSGGLFVDSFVSNTGNIEESICWVFHDASYSACAYLGGSNPITRDLADELLYQGLVKAGMGKWKAKVVWRSVSWFGTSAYESEPEFGNENLFRFYWK